MGTIADYLLALLLASVFSVAYILASTCGFILGSIVNYCGHSIFSYEHTSRKTISVTGYVKYLLAVASEVVAPFVTSYVISTLWVFQKPG